MARQMFDIFSLEKKWNSLKYSLSVVSESLKRITLWNCMRKELESFVKN